MLEKKGADVPESGGDATPGRRRRADRAIETRRKLMDAAAKVVGEEGYANASVAKITAIAEIAQGTFYNYFASQQDLFDQLLPELGTELLEFIRHRIAGESGSFRREEIGFRAFFDFLAERPEFYRILNEAETFAPKAYHDHMRNMAEGYTRALSRSHAKGELPGFERRELEVVIYTMLAARNYISYRYLFRDGRSRRLPAWVDRAYMKLMTGGMMYGGTAERPRRGRRSAPSAKSALDSDAAHFRSVSADPGEARVELEVTDACLDADGAIRRGILLKLIEAAATASASEISEAPPRLLSLSTTFPHAAGDEDLVAVARAQRSGGAIHVSIDVQAVNGVARAIAAAQAVYETERRSTEQDES
ncbi:MAG TPA: TetR/AcrR family transcriptional regulator [Hyphomicrobiaceae bacterium]|nr:TetR/AcrR family transcriptional regulator [Hyphomicrobiaceae bacterium]